MDIKEINDRWNKIKTTGFQEYEWQEFQKEMYYQDMYLMDYIYKKINLEKRDWGVVIDEAWNQYIKAITRMNKDMLKKEIGKAAMIQTT